MNRQLIIAALLLVLSACSGKSEKSHEQLSQDQHTNYTEKEIYTSDQLIIKQIRPNTYVHVSFLDTDSFGKVECNGMIVISDGEAIIFDTPSTSNEAEELITFLEGEKLQIKAVVATHFHMDCLGGLEAFHAREIPSYAFKNTLSLASQHGFPQPKMGFQDQLALKVGSRSVFVHYFGEGHTEDNVIGYFPDDQVLFGGCLVKADGAGKGNLEDANITAWPTTVNKITAAYPTLQLVIPGHGKWGDKSLLTYTETLFQ
ncbi:subclass B1 metallo-beta-lactamase [Echinicola strongylocentroti]|uniref:beta-lactamase n=1 Tax=Echinicola strongylocentroti TaxID=1795355 RepID=A0A2Z4IMZ5_9BACT|nr:subclass B1 metallo-beta-lactamase [Echinicola strongylocentroti]AWW32099.1 subclass B1 metallo-beta-lactamase [Echinicola strongylocentroti]